MPATVKSERYKALARATPAVETALDDANRQSAEELSDMIRGFAPKKRGRYAKSIRIERMIDPETGPAWQIVALFIWRFLEFGVAPFKSKGRSHPGMPAQPHVFPARRALAKKMRGRAGRAITKAIKVVTK